MYLVLFALPLSAAGPLTHAFLTEMYLMQHSSYSNEEKDLFRIGSLFPDIRHLAETERDHTHFPHVTLQEVFLEASPFIAGMKYHAYVDKKREAFMERGGHYNLISDLPLAYPRNFLKFVEDEIIFTSLNRNDWRVLLQNTVPEEMEWGIREEVVIKWHQLLDWTLTFLPSTLIYFADVQGNGLLSMPADEISIWNANVYERAHRAEVRAYFNSMLKMFDESVKGLFKTNK